MRHELRARLARGSITVLGLALIGIAIVIVGERGARATPPVTKPLPLTVPVVVAREENGFTLRQDYTGQVEGRRRTTLAFERSARILAIEFDEGQAVAADAVLATLDERDLAIAKRLTLARIAEAQAQLDELRAGPRVERIEAARAELAAIEAEHALAALREQRRTQLLGSDATSKEELEAASFGRQALAGRRSAAQARLKELERGTRKERVAAAKARVETLQAGLAQIALDAEKSSLRAPFAGRIAVRHLDEGTVVSPGTPVLTLLESAALEARIGIPSHEPVAWEVGGVVPLLIEGRQVDARFERFEAEIERQTRSRVAIFSLPAEESLLAGAIARVRKERHVAQDGFWLPRKALTRSVRGLWACFVVERPHAGSDEPGIVHRRALEVLHEDGERVFVRGTLRAGERVIADGTRRVVDGQTVVAERAGS